MGRADLGDYPRHCAGAAVVRHLPPGNPDRGLPRPGPSQVCHDIGWFLQNITNLTDGPLAIWSGGLSIFGAVLGGLLGAYLYMRRNKLPVGPWLDVAAVALPVGQAIGRWANFVNQELYGSITSLPWGITIDSAHRVAPYTSTIDYPVATTFFHPLFLYELLWSILAFIVLLNVFLRYRNRLIPGDIFLLYIVQYSAIRFLLEFLRAEPAYLPGTTLNSSQTATALAFMAALLFFLYRHRAGSNASTVRPPDPKPAEAKQVRESINVIIILIT